MEHRKQVRRRRTILAGCLSCVVATGAPAQSTFDSLRKLIDQGQITGVEQYIAALPADWRAHYVLVYNSRSLQGASFTSPRAILFGNRADFVASFNGDPAQRGYSAIETMEFDARTGQFLFREIQFPSAASAGGAVTISEPNPARCAACHDDPARPIWDLPPSWPGVYGERYRAGLSAQEDAGMHEFLRVQAEHPRYRYLLGAGAWAQRDMYVRNQRAAYDGSALEPPNERLSVLLANLNTRRILSELAVRPQFEPNAYVLLAAAGSSCGSLTNFFPGPQGSEVERDYARFAAATRDADRRQDAAKSGRRTAGAPRRGLAAQTDFTQLRYVVERDLQLSTEHWTLALERGTYDMSSPEGSLSLEQALFQWVAPSDPTLRHVAAYRTFDAKDAYCDYLRSASRHALGSWYAAHPADTQATVGAKDSPTIDPSKPALLERCIVCHGGDVAPALPFGDPKALGARLLHGRYPRGRLIDEILYRLGTQAGADSMPRGMTLEPAERRALEDYFLALAREAPSL